MHIDNTTNTEAQIFMDTMEAPGLQQHVNFQIHHAGNTIDLIFTENTSQFSIRTIKGRHISDHRVIVTELDMRIQYDIGKTVTFRDLKQKM